jgi:hypothetical protein
MNAAASQRDIHASPCQYSRGTRSIVIAMFTLVGFVSGFVLFEVREMNKDVRANTTSSAEANIKFAYISTALDEIKAEVRKLP